MSYQIKSTPYFQRMLTKSKRNGELQRLKEEYERIKDFSDHTIAMRIRQVRLRRLFREIRDINAISRYQRPRRQITKTYAQMRAEELLKARELGTEYSRENGMNIQRFGPYTSNSIPNTSINFPTTINPRAELEKKASCTAKRIVYGNTISAYNLKRFQKSKNNSINTPTSVPTNLSTASSSVEVTKVEKLRNHVNYENTMSTLNVNGKRKMSKVGKAPQKISRSTETSHTKMPILKKRGHLNEIRREAEAVKNYTFVLDEFENNANENKQQKYIEIDKNNKNVDNDNDHEDVDDDDDDDGQYIPISMVLKNDLPHILKKLDTAHIMLRARAKDNSAHKLIMKNNKNEILEEDFDSVPDESDEEFTLRKIDNDRNLPLSEFKKNVLPTIDNFDEDAQFVVNEELIKISKLNDNHEGEAVVEEETVEEEIRLENIDNEENYNKNEKPAFEQLMPKEYFTDRPQATQRNLKNKPLPDFSIQQQQQQQEQQSTQLLIRDHVKDFVKLYEPFPHDDEENAPIKDGFNSGVAKLRSIFEHQGE